MSEPQEFRGSEKLALGPNGSREKEGVLCWVVESHGTRRLHCPYTAFSIYGRSLRLLGESRDRFPEKTNTGTDRRNMSPQHSVMSPRNAKANNFTNMRYLALE
jgi:hypothetical protein